MSQWNRERQNRKHYKRLREAEKYSRHHNQKSVEDRDAEGFFGPNATVIRSTTKTTT